jgi:hypothetical protein
LYDISCLYGKAEFAQIQDDVFDFWQKYNGNDPSDPNLINEFLSNFYIPLIGNHYFINDTGTLAPKFDFTSAGPTKGNPDAFVVATKAVDVPAPDSTRDVDWLDLKAVSGKVADDVFRVETRGGQPPTSVSFSPSLIFFTCLNMRSLQCAPGSGPISVKYAAQYCEYT